MLNIQSLVQLKPSGSLAIGTITTSKQRSLGALSGLTILYSRDWIKELSSTAKTFPLQLSLSYRTTRGQYAYGNLLVLERGKDLAMLVTSLNLIASYSSTEAINSGEVEISGLTFTV